jgi:hypothetical protein
MPGSGFEPADVPVIGKAFPLNAVAKAVRYHEDESSQEKAVIYYWGRPECVAADIRC